MAVSKVVMRDIMMVGWLDFLMVATTVDKKAEQRVGTKVVQTVSR